MFSDTHNFTIESSTFNEAESITINYNVLLVDDSRRLASTGLQDGKGEEKMKELVKLVETLVLKKKEEKEEEGSSHEGEKIEGEVKEILESVPETIPLSTKKRLVFYTNVDIAAKKLKRPVNILFTLTPFQYHENGYQSLAITWKIISFQPQMRSQETLTWFDEMGFAAVSEKNDGTLKSGDLAVIVKPQHAAVLMSESDVPFFSEEEVKVPVESTSGVTICNMSDMDQRFALCMIDYEKQETDSFSPLVDIGTLSPRSITVCGPPVMLQAYAVPSGYHERKPIDVSKLKPLFVEGGAPRAIDVGTLGERTAFRLFNNMRGQIFLERDR